MSRVFSKNDMVDFFTENELAELLKSGDDSRDNLIVIDKIGKLKMLHDPDLTIVSENYSVRLDVFRKGNNLVGIESDLIHLEDVYQRLLEGFHSWLKRNEHVIKEVALNEKTTEELVSEISMLSLLY